jgi:hypothetical protein
MAFTQYVLLLNSYMQQVADHSRVTWIHPAGAWGSQVSGRHSGHQALRLTDQLLCTRKPALTSCLAAQLPLAVHWQ